MWRLIGGGETIEFQASPSPIAKRDTRLDDIGRETQWVISRLRVTNDMEVHCGHSCPYM